jgi:hypothetical protein
VWRVSQVVITMSHSYGFFPNVRSLPIKEMMEIIV